MQGKVGDIMIARLSWPWEGLKESILRCLRRLASRCVGTIGGWRHKTEVKDHARAGTIIAWTNGFFRDTKKK